jgi:hypothetical protein
MSCSNKKQLKKEAMKKREGENKSIDPEKAERKLLRRYAQAFE